MKGIIVAIGGGKIYAKETLPIDKYIVGLVKKKKPVVLFIPTASKDSSEYCETFTRIYGDILSCRIEFLLLIKNKKTITDKEIKEKINRADIIYVSGGSTLYLMTQWKRHGIDKLLARAYTKGKILAGNSAGSICWFKGGFSDSFKNRFVVIRGIGLINAYNCPHYNLENVKQNFLKNIDGHKDKKVWYAMENNTALVVKKDKYEIIKAKYNSSGYLYKFVRGEWSRVEIL